MDINFFGAVRLTNFVVNRMIEDNQQKTSSKQRKRAFSIVNVGSIQSYLGIPYRSICTFYWLWYWSVKFNFQSFCIKFEKIKDCSSKHALLAYSDALRAELYAHRNIDIINLQPGYINTNVSINALTSDGNKHSVNDDDHRNGFDPNDVARQMINTILRRDKEVMVSVLLHRVAIWIRFFFPNLYFWIMYKRAKKTYENKFQWILFCFILTFKSFIEIY